jgi:formylglycine-generating enzyme required for sulfatase activity
MSSKRLTYQPIGTTPASIPVFTLGGLEFICVPAGKFIMGSSDDNPLAYDNEKPCHTVDIPYDFWLTRFLVTNEQYAVYIGEGRHPVSGWKKKRNHAVVNVTWKDTLAYCKWLNERLKDELPQGAVLRLPTEAEWEKAARGENGYEWPWGNEFDKAKCDLDERGRWSTTPIGTYSPQGDSPYGCADMVGNVWEWTHSKFKPYPYRADDGREDEKGAVRAMRGGAFPFNRGHARVAFRGRHLPVFLWLHYGFRVAVVFPISPS